MIHVSSEVELDLEGIVELKKAQILALEQTAEALHTEVIQEQVIPRDTGSLQNESTFVDCSNSKRGQVSIVSNTPYARRLYFHPEYKFSKTENPNAKGEWYEDWLDGGKYENFVTKTFMELYRRIAGL